MLTAFLETMAATPFVDGRADCILTVCDWVMLKRGCPDPAADLRGRYRTPLGRARLLKRLGGIESAMTERAARAGLTTTGAPQREDVGLVEMSGRQLAAICLGEAWAAKGEGLVVEIPSRILKAWSV